MDVKEAFNQFAARTAPLGAAMVDAKAPPPPWWPTGNGATAQDWRYARDRAYRALVDRLFLGFCEALASGKTLEEIAAGSGL
jgi:hypothetical protein